MFHIFFQDFIGTYIAQPGLSQMLSKTQQSMTHAVEVMVDIQQSHQQSTTQLQSQRTEESIAPNALTILQKERNTHAQSALRMK